MGEGTYLDDRIGDLRRGHDAIRRKHPIGFLLAQLVEQERAHATASPPTKRVDELVSLKRVAFFGLSADEVLHAHARALFREMRACGDERRTRT
jgi:hypothetical protein